MFLCRVVGWGVSMAGASCRRRRGSRCGSLRDSGGVAYASVLAQRLVDPPTGVVEPSRRARVAVSAGSHLLIFPVPVFLVLDSEGDLRYFDGPSEVSHPLSPSGGGGSLGDHRTIPSCQIPKMQGNGYFSPNGQKTASFSRP